MDTISHNCAESANDKTIVPTIQPRRIRGLSVSGTFPWPTNGYTIPKCQYPIACASLLPPYSPGKWKIVSPDEDHLRGKFPRNPKAVHPPRFPDLSVAFFRILIDDPAGEVAHLM